LTEQDQSLAVRLRRRRRALGWSQEKLAATAKTTQTVIQKIENGKSLRPRNLHHIASALGVSPAWLAFGVATVAELDPEVLAVAKAWSELHEPKRSEIKEAIFRALGKGP
jgi:transcriptional regulator with XRE-family HTH domain